MGTSSPFENRRIHGCTRTLRGNVKFFLHRGRRPYMAHRDIRCIARLCLRLKVSAQRVDATQALDLSDGCNEYDAGLHYLQPAAATGKC